MPALRASFVPSSLTRALVRGEVEPGGLQLAVEDNSGLTTAAIIDQNSKRMVAFDLDIGEMSFGTFVRARDLGRPLLALPVFPGRRFLQPAIAVLPGSGIRSPADFRGQRVAVGQFWQTAFIWHRLLLHTHYGVRQEEVSWVCTAPERWDALPPPPPGTRLDASGRDPLQLLAAGEVDAALVANGQALQDRPQGDGPQRLFADSVQAQREYYRQTGLFPIIHLVALREELARDAALVAALCEALAESKRRGLADMVRNPAETPVLGGDSNEVEELFGPDPWPYGIGPNRRVLEVYLEDVHSHQRLTERRLQVEELFAPALPAEFG